MKKNIEKKLEEERKREGGVGGEWRERDTRDDDTWSISH